MAVVVPVDLLQGDDMGVDLTDHRADPSGIPAPIGADGAMDIVGGDADRRHGRYRSAAGS